MSCEVIIVPMVFDLACLLYSMVQHNRRITLSGKLEYALDKEEAADVRSEVESMRRAGCDIRTGTTEFDAVVHTEEGYDIGFRRNEKGAYDIVTHWSEQPGKVRMEQARSDIESRIKQKYAYEKVRRELAKKGFTVASEEVQPDESIKLVVRKW